MTGGIYIASNVPDSTRVWKCRVTNDEVIGKNGNIEPMREFLPVKGTLLEPGCVYWMSDRTPHESLPMKTTTMRQFFRIMTSEVQFWFKDYYTANPLGVVPDPHVTEMVVGRDHSEEKLQILHAWKAKGYHQMTTEEERLQKLQELQRLQKEEERRREIFNGRGLDGNYPHSDSDEENDSDWDSDWD